MTRIDKVKLKKEKNKVINLDISRLKVKLDESYKDYNDESWYIKKEKSSDREIKISSLFTKKYFNKKYIFPIEFRHYLKQRKNIVARATLLSETKTIRHFILKFAEDTNTTIKSFKDIDYEILLKYSEYIRRQNTNTSIYYKRLLNILNNALKTEGINVSIDVIKRNYPNVKLPKNKTKEIILYSEEEFIVLSSLVKEMIKQYFTKGCTNKPLFVKSAYWYIAMFTGFNQTGMNSLKIDSFKLIKEESKSFFYVVCEKNRSVFGQQSMIIPLSDDNELFLKTFNELKRIRTEVSEMDKNLFTYINNGKLFEYLGISCDFHNLKMVKDYIQNNNIENINTLSTHKIRQFFSSKMMDKTKSEQLVSKIMGHKNIITTEKHYMKNKVDNNIKFKFNVVQNLMNAFSNSKQFDDWVAFQNTFDLNNLSAEEVYLKLKEGFFNNALGQCIKDNNEKEDKCRSYINCFCCKNYTIVGEIDLWKVISFKESLLKNYGKKNEIQWIVEIINETLKESESDLLLSAKQRISKYGLYPFWRNELMVKTILEDYETLYNE